MPKRKPQQKPVMSRATKALIVLQVLTVLALLWFKGRSALLGPAALVLLGDHSIGLCADSESRSEKPSLGFSSKAWNGSNRSCKFSIA